MSSFRDSSSTDSHFLPKESLQSSAFALSPEHHKPRPLQSYAAAAPHWVRVVGPSLAKLTRRWKLVVHAPATTSASVWLPEPNIQMGAKAGPRYH